MSAAILLLMKDPEAAFFRELLEQAETRAELRHVPTRRDLEAAVADLPARSRLIAFSTQVIVPPHVLEALDHDCYNFHPGPPSYPGSKPSAFAIHEGASRFGVTLHHMVARVDSGPIVATDWFDIPTTAVTAPDLATEAYIRMARLAVAHADTLAEPGCPLAASGEAWTGRPRTLAEYEALRRIETPLGADELERRLRACDGIYSPLPASSGPGPGPEPPAAPATAESRSLS